uniref:Zinc finger CCCH-type with G patch domain-containing protein n=1 Tax=Glossina brevipalpis TaxID=37001 RepID=A0A1A9WHJ1_9MUSC
MNENINEYELQLLNVERALLVNENASERNELLALKDNLVELLALTGASAEENKHVANDKTKVEQETANNQLAEIKKNYDDMVGRKCSAPHKHTWGAIAYHNAIICGVDNTVYVDEDGNLDVKLRVLFTNPTHREMLPCNYYLEGNCRFDDESCHFSHGESVSASKLREYSTPDFERLGRNCIVLARLPDRIWYRGRVLCANFVEKMCCVRLDGKEKNEKEQNFLFEDLLPIFQDDDVSSDYSSDSDTHSNYDWTTSSQLDNLFTYHLTQPLGEWEKHTKGIGSKLMAKMGYVFGTGLGVNGGGIITPVSAQILPPGRSLDHCMELREAANGDKDLFSVEKKLQTAQKKQAILNAKAYDRECQRVDVFSFLNDNVLTATGHNTIEKFSSKTDGSFQNHSIKSLNVESVRVADDIKRKEREIAELQKSLKRHNDGTEIYKRLKQTFNSKSEELHALKREETSLSKEQANRKTKEKLCIF